MTTQRYGLQQDLQQALYYAELGISGAMVAGYDDAFGFSYQQSRSVQACHSQYQWIVEQMRDEGNTMPLSPSSPRYF